MMRRDPNPTDPVMRMRAEILERRAAEQLARKERAAAIVAERQAGILPDAMPAMRPTVVQTQGNGITTNYCVHVEPGLPILFGEAVGDEYATVREYGWQPNGYDLRDTLGAFPRAAFCCSVCKVGIQGRRGTLVLVQARNGVVCCERCHARHHMPNAIGATFLEELTTEHQRYEAVTLENSERIRPGISGNFAVGPRHHVPLAIVVHPHSITALNYRCLWTENDARLASYADQLAERNVWLYISQSEPTGLCTVFHVENSPPVTGVQLHRVIYNPEAEAHAMRMAAA